MLEILGYMFAVYAIWRMLDAISKEGTSSFRMLLAILAILGVALCVYMLTSQGEEVRRQVTDSSFPLG